MATIALYANKINQMPGLLNDLKQSVTDYSSELSALRAKTLTINSSICNLDDVISSIQSSTQTQEQKIASIETISREYVTFVTDAAQIDYSVAEMVNQRKDDFYNKFYYLKPETEKGWLEKAGDWFIKAYQWCKDN